MIIIHPNPDSVSDEEEIDEYDTKQPIIWYERDSPDTTGTIEIFVNDSEVLQLPIKNLKWIKREPKLNFQETLFVIEIMKI